MMWCDGRSLALAVALLLCSGGAASAATAAAGDVAAPPGDAVAPAGDAAHGKQLYARCSACHSLTVDRTGPRHCGLLGRRAGGVPGFAYSDAMRKSGIVWSVATLDRFLADPMKAVPGTAMGYSGISDAGERADLVAFLAKASASEACGS
jgi:cytochrome c